MIDLDVLSFGEALVDFFPPRAGLSLQACDEFVRHLGGAPANVAIGLARGGLRVGMCTLVGPDAFGAFVLDALAKEGIDVRAIGRHPTAKTGIAFVSVASDGARSFLFFRHPSADLAITPAEVVPDAIARAHVLHLGSSTLSREPSRAATLRAVELARRAGRMISIDPNLRPHLWEDLAEARALLAPILASAAVVKISDDELEPLLGISGGAAAAEEGARALRALGCGVALVTLGAGGAYFDAPSGRGHVPAIPTPVIDTTGAGDAFVAGFWRELAVELRAGIAPATLARARLEAAVAAGCRLGAAAVSAMGATTAIPRANVREKTRSPTGLRPWTFVRDQEIARTSILVLGARTLVSPRTGVERSFSRITCADWCNIVALTDDDDVVMIRQQRHGTDEITLELPGGVIDPEDHDPAAAAVRELEEETGYGGAAATIVGVVAPNPAMQTNHSHTAFARGVRLLGPPEQDDGEDIEVVLIPYREIPGRLARGEFTHALVVAAFAFALGVQPPRRLGS